MSDIDDEISGLKVRCIKCGELLKESGGLVFSYPDSDGQCFKYHLCRTCWHSQFLPWID